VLQACEVREFFIMSEENEDGQLSLSIRRIEYQRAWERVRQLQKEDATKLQRSSCAPQTAAVPWFGVDRPQGLHPQAATSATRKPKEDLVADSFPLKFLEVDEERNRLVSSAIGRALLSAR